MKIITKLLNIIYPIKCIECGEINESYLCKKCRARLNFEIRLHKNNNKTKYQDKKNLEEKHYDAHYYLFRYEGFIRNKIIEYKFNNKAYLYRLFVELILEINKETLFLNNYDFIIPVPISKKRMLERGYNQCELIAKKICRKNISLEGINSTKIKMIKLVKKSKDNLIQSTLTAKERKENVRGVYGINEEEINRLVNYEKIKNIKNKRFLLFDDIYTTGNTVNEIAKILKNFGIIKLDVLSITKG